MFWLLACTTAADSIDLSITPPAAAHALARSAEAFVGPVAARELDADACDPDRRALLRSGRFGWRVLGLGPDGLRTLDGESTPEVAAPRDRMREWVAADRIVAKRCGTTASTPVLLAVDAAHPFDTKDLFAPGLFGGIELWILVSDPEPAARMPAAGRTAAGFFLMLGVTRQTWVVLGSTGEIAASEHFIIDEAAQRVVELGHPDVVMSADRGLPWSRVVEGIDALAGLGVEPRFGLTIGDSAVSTAEVRAPGLTTISIEQTLSVLRFAPPGYASNKGGATRGSPLIQVIGIGELPITEALGLTPEIDLFGPAQGAEPGEAEPSKGPLR